MTLVGALELTDSGFDSTVLCEFRARLVKGDPEHLILDRLLGQCRSAGGSRPVEGSAQAFAP
jgi:transposase